MPIYKNQYLELTLDMGINLDNNIGLAIIMTRPDGSQQSFTATRVGTTSKVRRIFVQNQLDTAGECAFNPQADFGAGNVVPGKTRFIDIQILGT